MIIADIGVEVAARSGTADGFDDSEHSVTVDLSEADLSALMADLPGSGWTVLMGHRAADLLGDDVRLVPALLFSLTSVGNE